MAKPLNKNMETIATKYQTGQYGINELARMYKVDKSTISRYIKRHNITINQHAKDAINHLTQGLNEFNEICNGNTGNTLSQQNQHLSISEIENAHKNSVNLANEVIEIVREKNPQFAKGFQAISSLILKRSAELLQKDGVTSQDLTNVSRAMTNINQTLGVIPQMPTIAQQININGKSTEANKKDNTKIDLDIKFV